MGSRRVGLSYLDSPKPLLKSIKSRTEAKTTTATTTTTEAAPKPKLEPRAQSRRSQIKVEPTDDIFAPPLASSDLEDEGSAEDADVNVKSEQSIADSSDSDAPPRGAISSTTFKSEGQKGGRSTRRSTLQEAPKLEEEPEESQSTAKKRKRPSDGSPEKSKPKKNAHPKTEPTVKPLNMANHLIDSHGFVKRSEAKNKFGKRNPLAQGIRLLPKEESATPARFRPPPEYGTNTPRKSWKFIVPDSAGFDSPVKRTRRLMTLEPIHYENENEDADEDDEDDNDTVAYSQPGSFTGGAEPATKGKAKGKRKANPLRSRKLLNRIKGEPKEDADQITSSPPPAKFVMPAQLSDFVPPGNGTGNGDDIHDGDLSDASSSDLSSLGGLFPDKEGDGGAQCPWCGATVDMKLLKDFSNGKRLNVRLQTKFCEEHRKKSAMATWESKAYPDVEWASLESRFKKHQNRLLDIINGSEESFYRTALAEKIEQGQGRSMKKEENLNPGYYGPRGFNMMCDYLVKEYSDMLKKKAVHDKVIAGRGSAAFIQAVLVAELGVQLIMEDMLVSPEEARHILEESKPIGDLVHADNWL